MKCADIPDDTFLDAVRDTYPRTENEHWRSRTDVRATLETTLGQEIPEKLFLAKARKLIDKKGKLAGCSCGCLGRYHLPEECKGWC